MSIRAPLLVVIVLGYCLVSLVSAGCSACSAAPEGGWGPPDQSKDPYWGMSIDEIMNARSSAGKSDTTSEAGPPKLIMPASNASKFGSLIGYNSKFGDFQSIFTKNVSSLKPDLDVKSNLFNKQLFF